MTIDAENGESIKGKMLRASNKSSLQRVAFYSAKPSYSTTEPSVSGLAFADQMPLAIDLQLMLFK